MFYKLNGSVILVLLSLNFRRILDKFTKMNTWLRNRKILERDELFLASLRMILGR